jgi:DNA-binding LytR/AlgR family response regulator
MDNLKFLVVENDSIMSEIIKKMLNVMGYETVYFAKTGLDAIGYMQKKEIDMILMDTFIDGDMDGIDAANNIMQHYNIPIIFITSSSDDETLIRATATNTFGYLVKPFSYESLYVAIVWGYQQFKKCKQTEYRAKKNKKILVWRGDQIYVLNTDEVFYLEIFKGIIKIHSEKGIFTMRGTLNEWENKLAEYNFFRSHKSFLINVDKITKMTPCIDNTFLIELEGMDTKVPLSRTKAQLLNQFLCK